MPLRARFSAERRADICACDVAAGTWRISQPFVCRQRSTSRSSPALQSPTSSRSRSPHPSQCSGRTLPFNTLGVSLRQRRTRGSRTALWTACMASDGTVRSARGGRRLWKRSKRRSHARLPTARLCGALREHPPEPEAGRAAVTTPVVWCQRRLRLRPIATLEQTARPPRPLAPAPAVPHAISHAIPGTGRPALVDLDGGWFDFYLLQYVS